MPRRIIVFVVLAVVMAAVFVRLGIWQLRRLGERRARNALVSAWLQQPERPFAQVSRDSAPSHRKAFLQGTPDTANEFLVTGRSRNGSPGVHIITPVRVPGSDSAVLVNRGWVYAPDAATIDVSRWRERRSAFHGYTLLVPYTETPMVKGRGTREFSVAAAHALVPYPVSDVYLLAQDSGAVDSIPARLVLPPLDDGPHLNYAIQWFSFAAIAIAGAVIVARRSRVHSDHVAQTAARH